MKIVKFGGTSVGTEESFRRVADLIRADEAIGGVVVSALGGTTDALLSVSQRAVASDSNYVGLLEAIEHRHFELLRALLPVQAQGAALGHVKRRLNELEDLLHGVFLLKEISPRTRDLLLSFGEQLSAYTLATYLNTLGHPARYADARAFVRTDDHFGHARVDKATTEALVRSYWKEDTALPIATGFIGATERGETTTLGRGGSDYTAALLAAALHADIIEIWTDVDGVMTADPRRVPTARPLPHLSYAEAMELSHFGAKVIYPPTLQPALAAGIPLVVRNTHNPAYVGTRIDGSTSGDHPVKGISSLPAVSLLVLEGSGLVGVPGVAARLFGALAAHRVNVVLITQASSEHSICFAVAPDAVPAAQRAVSEAFDRELAAGLIDPLVVKEGLAVLAIVGAGMQQTPGVSGRLFGALGRNGINVVATAQGASELNVSVVIEATGLDKALRAVHDAFFVGEQHQLNLYLVGTGLIGSELLRQIAAHGEALRRERALHLHLRAVANSRRTQWRATEDPWPALDVPDGTPTDLTTFFRQLWEDDLPNQVLIDCTPGTALLPYYAEALRRGVAVVTPNKRANTSSYDDYRKLQTAARRYRASFRYETNVGAGLPVIGTLQGLRASGDTVHRIEGVLSGTLSYLFNAFAAGAPFSSVLRGARDRGLTEPDPRDDLSGEDVARKLLILAREAGLPLERTDLTVENLVPPALRDAPDVDTFLNRLSDHDEAFATRRRAAADRGERLCYVATLTPSSAAVGLRAVGPESPFYALSGSDNMIAFTTARYTDRPLVIRGPGAGAEVTAAGVFADIVSLSERLS